MTFVQLYSFLAFLGCVVLLSRPAISATVISESSNNRTFSGNSTDGEKLANPSKDNEQNILPTSTIPSTAHTQNTSASIQPPELQQVKTEKVSERLELPPHEKRFVPGPPGTSEWIPKDNASPPGTPEAKMAAATSDRRADSIDGETALSPPAPPPPPEFQPRSPQDQPALPSHTMFVRINENEYTPRYPYQKIREFIEHMRRIIFKEPLPPPAVGRGPRFGFSPAFPRKTNRGRPGRPSRSIPQYIGEDNHRPRLPEPPRPRAPRLPEPPRPRARSETRNGDVETPEYLSPEGPPLAEPPIPPDHPHRGEVELVNVTEPSRAAPPASGHYHGVGSARRASESDVELVDVEAIYGEAGTGCRCVRPSACPAGGRKAHRCGNEYVCCPNENLYTAKCGRLAHMVDNQRDDVVPAVPWAAALLLRLGTGHVFICGGALIHPQVVLTAARCVATLGDMAPYLVARLGDGITIDNRTHAQPQGRPPPFQEIRVGRVILHPKYQRFQPANDVALLFLNESATLRPGLDTICLRRKPTTAHRCLLASYSIMHLEPIHHTLRLRTANKTWSSRGTCLPLGRRWGPFLRMGAHLCQQPMAKLWDMTCPLGRDRAGSPLSCADPQSGEHQLTGVVAWGQGCAVPLSHGLFTRVQPFYKWIDSVVTRYFRYFESYFGFNQV